VTRRHMSQAELTVIAIEAAYEVVSRPGGKRRTVQAERAAWKAVCAADPQAGTSTHEHEACRYSHGVAAITREGVRKALELTTEFRRVMRGAS
jgi:hypothetical protein